MPPPLRQISVTELRIRAGEYLDRANLSHEAFVITRADRGKAVLLSAAAYLDLIEQLEALQVGKRPPSKRSSGDGAKILSAKQLQALLK